MGKVEIFPTIQSFQEFINSSRHKKQSTFTDWIMDYIEENRAYIAENDDMISPDEIKEYIS